MTFANISIKILLYLQESCQSVMDSEKYFQEIAETVHERRTKGEFSSEEKRIYEEGRSRACRDILVCMGEKQTVGDLRKKFERALDFLKKQKSYGKIAIFPADTEIWEKPLQFDSWTLVDMILLQVSDLKMRLQKAREIHALDKKIISEMTQLSID